MSAPQTDIEKQERQHWVPLAGMVLATLFGVGLILLWLIHEAEQAPDMPAPASAVGAEP